MRWIERVLGSSRKLESAVPHAVDVRARYTDTLMASAGVVSVGVGQDANGRPTIIVGVTAAEGEAIALPRSIEGVPVVVQTMGTIRARD